MSLLFITDFDGTVTLKDTVEEMVIHFAKGDWKSVNRLWEERKLDTEETARRVFAMFDADEKDIIQFLDKVEVDPYFALFAKEVKTYKDSLYIVSDGYDYLISYLLEREGLKRIPFYANRMKIEGRKFFMKSGMPKADCGLCGTCKRKVMSCLKKPGQKLVFIGDGYSDICAAGYADIVFAKDYLLDYCIEHKINCLGYQNFADILAWYQSEKKLMGGDNQKDVE